MLFSKFLLAPKQDPRRSLLEHDLYDDQESFVGSIAVSSAYGIENSPQKNISTVFCDFHEKWTCLSEDPLALSEAYSKLTEELLDLFPKPGSRTTFSKKTSSQPSLHDTIDSERSAWQLLHALYADRLHSVNSCLKGRRLKKPCHSEKEIVTHLYDTDVDLREAQIVVDWLEGKVREAITKVAEKYECLFNETTVWENTRHLLETVGIDTLREKNIITQFFPDSTVVGQGGLVQADIADENRFLHYIFLCIRAGDLPRAQRLCVQRGDITRAVSMEAWRPFHSSHLSDDNVVTEEDCPATVEGNASRVVSKCVAWWNAENPNFHIYERAVFAAQSGHLRALLQVMTSGSWEDLLWAHCRALVEARVDAHLRTTHDCGPRADTLSVIGRPQKGLDLDDIGIQVPDQSWIPGSWTLSEAFSKAEAVLGWSPIDCLRRSVVGGGGAVNASFRQPILHPSEISAFLNPTDPLNCTQPEGQSRICKKLLIHAMFFSIYRAITLREYSDMLEAVASVCVMFVPAEIRDILSAGVTNATWPEKSALDPMDCQILRFLAHFVLCLQRLETNLPTVHCTTILEVFLATLIVERRFSLIAEYTAHLTPTSRQTRWYASFLSGIRQPEQREQCLAYGFQAGLNLQRITRAVIRIARRRFDEVDRLAAAPGGPAPAFVVPPPTAESIVGEDVAGYLTQADKNRIAAIDWLVHDPAQRGEALVLGNSLLRLFIAMRKFRAARAVLARLPLAILDQLKLKLLQAEEAYGAETARAAIPPWLTNTVREHECLLVYLQACESFKQWYEHLNASKPTPPLVFLNSDVTSQTLAERVSGEEAERAYQSRLECWRHEVDLSTSSLVVQLESLLTYEAPGWLVDAVVLGSTSRAGITTILNLDEALDVTGMFAQDDAPSGLKEEGGSGRGEEEEEEEEEEVGIAGLGDSPHVRKLQLTVLRETCLRDVVFMLVEVYKATGRHAECVRLADLVAENEFGIYKLFTESQMQRLLRDIQESMLHLQDECGDALGYIADRTNHKAGT